jgi:hypothetical protein
MTRKPTKDKKQSDDTEIMERMNEALKRMMNTPPETHKEMVERRRGHAKSPPLKRPKKGA